MPPPSVAAELPLRVLSVTVSVRRVVDAAAVEGGRVAAEGAGGDRHRAVVVDAAAVDVAELPLRVQAVTVTVPRVVDAAAAEAAAELPLRVLSVTVSVPPLEMPPPPLAAELPLRVLSVTVSVPSL